jgi:asparagine synthase (glutamine-hydrolysing)
LSGILGIWNLDGHPVAATELAILAKPLAHRAIDAIGLWANGCVGLAYLPLSVSPESLIETQPHSSQHGAVLVFDGRLDNREELFSSLRDLTAVEQNSPDAALVIAAYEYLGRKFPACLKGDFAFAIYDNRTRLLLLTRDLIGMRPLYYCRLADTFLFASEAKAILAHPAVSRRIDDNGLAQVVLPGRAVRRELTCFQGIHAILPGQMGIATMSGWTVTQVLDFDTTRSVRYENLAEYAEAFEFLFCQSVRRRLRSAFPVGISVSGGLDSSGIFCMAEKLRTSRRELPTVAGITMGFPASTPGDEEPFWRILEREYGILIEQVPWEHGNLRRAEAFVWHTELPQHHPLWNWQQSILETNRQREIRVVLTGFFGDQVLSANAYFMDLFRSLRWSKLLHHLRSTSRSMGVRLGWLVNHFLSNLFKSSIPHSVFPAARRLKLRIGPGGYPIWYSKSFRERGLTRGRSTDPECSSTHAGEHYQQLRSVDFLLRIEQTNKMYAMYGLDTATPFLDAELLAFLMSVPGDVVNCGGISKGLYRRSMAGILPQTIRERTSKGDSTFFVNQTTQQEFAAIKNYFSGDCLSIQLGYVDPDVVQRQLTKLTHSFPLPDDSATTSWDLAYLLGLELWLRVFFGGKTRVIAAAPEPTVLRTDVPMHNQRFSAAQ